MRRSGPYNNTRARARRPAARRTWRGGAHAARAAHAHARVSILVVKRGEGVVSCRHVWGRPALGAGGMAWQEEVRQPLGGLAALLPVLPGLVLPEPAPAHAGKGGAAAASALCGRRRRRRRARARHRRCRLRPPDRAGACGARPAPRRRRAPAPAPCPRPRGGGARTTRRPRRRGRRRRSRAAPPGTWPPSWAPAPSQPGGGGGGGGGGGLRGARGGHWRGPRRGAVADRGAAGCCRRTPARAARRGAPSWRRSGGCRASWAPPAARAARGAGGGEAIGRRGAAPAGARRGARAPPSWHLARGRVRGRPCAPPGGLAAGCCRPTRAYGGCSPAPCPRPTPGPPRQHRAAPGAPTRPIAHLHGLGLLGAHGVGSRWQAARGGRGWRLAGPGVPRVWWCRCGKTGAAAAVHLLGACRGRRQPRRRAAARQLAAVAAAAATTAPQRGAAQTAHGPPLDRGGPRWRGGGGRRSRVCVCACCRVASLVAARARSAFAQGGRGGLGGAARPRPGRSPPLAPPPCTHLGLTALLRCWGGGGRGASGGRSRPQRAYVAAGVCARAVCARTAGRAACPLPAPLSRHLKRGCACRWRSCRATIVL